MSSVCLSRVCYSTKEIERERERERMRLELCTEKKVGNFEIGRSFESGGGYI